MAEGKPVKRRSMVGWYDPRVLAHSAYKLVIANIFGRHSDTRLIEALASQPQNEFDYTASEGDFWFDYAADVGDGWNPTYAIADAIARPELTVDVHGKPEKTQAGRLLIFGGDEVYPYPTRNEYDVRTETPYKLAFAGRAHPDVFAIPGNHDWYDSLVAFSRLFCRPERGFADCTTRQTRSYFALKLPANWWLLAIDLQLGADLDEPQVQYFQKVASRMDDSARLIFCVPEPRWILEDAYPSHASYEELSSTRFLEEKVFKRKARVFLTGDLHFYKRHESAEGIQKITSGGGGAFLHPTHAPCTKELRNGFVQRAAYPDEKTSRRLTWRNFLFPAINPKSGWLYAFLYAMSAWLASASLEASDVIDVRTALAAAMNAAIRDPLNGMWLVSVIGAFIFFTDTHIRSWRILGGACHAVMHLAAAFAVGWLALLLTANVIELSYGSIAQLLLSGLITFVLGGPVGAFILGVYLFISIRIFGRHGNEAFSSLRIQDFKQWLRLRIDAAGVLTIYAIAIDRVPRRWREAQRNGKPTIEANDARATAPRLIDRVEIRP
ncbi:MAG TPA: Yip1 family protein [Steroidobacteraceae bacterium]